MSKKKSSEPNFTEEIAQADLDELRAQHRPSLRGHGWKQKGTQIICTTCTFKHSFYVSPMDRLVGFDKEGLPKFEKIKF